MEIPKDFFKQYSNLLEEWIPKEASIAIAVGEEYVYYAVGNIDLRIKEGQKIQSDSIAHMVMTNGCKIEAFIEETVFHAKCHGVGYPIDINGITAAIVIIMPLKLAVPPAPPYRFLTGKLEEEWRPIPVEKITHLESLQKKTWFYANKEPYKTSIPLKELQQRLPECFLRIHRSYIVNVLFIDRIIRDFSSNLLVLLQDGTELPVSQSYIADVRNALGF